MNAILLLFIGANNHAQTLCKAKNKKIVINFAFTIYIAVYFSSVYSLLNVWEEHLAIDWWIEVVFCVTVIIQRVEFNQKQKNSLTTPLFSFTEALRWK